MIEARQQTLVAPAAPVQPAHRDQRESAGRPGAGHPPAEGIDERFKNRLRLTVCCLALVVLAFVDRPGNILGDTKLDLAVNPVGFLDRALHLWDPAHFGQLQNQAVGYFFPAGPFFAIGKLMALPPWVVQRLWLAAILVAAFLGVVKLAGLFGIGTPQTRIVAGFAYALAPRGLSLLGILSSEFLPAAMLPWILVPLVRIVRDGEAASRGRTIRAVCQSAAAVALCSGVNAAATGAVLVLPLLYLIYIAVYPDRLGPLRRWRVLACWVPAVVLAIWWWAYPLLLLSKYGVSNIPYTESAAVTTSVTSLSSILRGTEDWTTYLIVNGHPWWPVGFGISNNALPTIVTGVIAGLGLAGLLGRGLPCRRYLLVVLGIGVVVISAGYLSGLGNPLAGPLEHLINGPLSPIRNLRKFDPLIRLPLALGLAHVLASARLPRVRASIGALAAVSVAALVWPAYTNGLSAAGDFPAIPGYWTSAAAWLNAHADNQAVLEEPGARFGEYVWGRPMDDVLQPFFTGDFASRQLDSVGSVGITRLLAAIDQRMASGAGSAGLAQALAWMGVRYVVVRNDLIRSDLREAWPARIHQALSESPGIVKVAQFGSIPIGSEFPDDVVTNLDVPYSPVEIYRVNGAEPAAAVQPVAGTLRVYGGPEALLTLADQHLLNGRPVLLNTDGSQLAASTPILTDSLRRRIRNFGEIRVDYSQTLTATDPASTVEAAADYLEPGWLPYLSVARYSGIANVTASSSVADIGAISSQSSTGRMPFGAVDGDQRTMWESGSLDGPVGQWIMIEFVHPVNPGTIAIAFANNRAIGPPVRQIAVRTAAGQLTQDVGQTAHPQFVQTPVGDTTWLRITITRTAPGPTFGRQVGIIEISIPGLAASRTIVAPKVTMPGGGDPAVVLLSKAEPQPAGCMLGGSRWICSPQLIRPTEEQYGFDHSFFLAGPARANLYGSAILTDPGLIAKYSWPLPGQPLVTASSTYTSDPQDQAVSAFDANPGTTWIAGGGSRTATLTIRWTRRKRITEVIVIRPTATASPTQVLISGAPGQIRGGLLVGSTAKLKFAPIRTNHLSLTFTPSILPLQVIDVVIPGVRPHRSGGPGFLRLPCGFGPRIELAGRLLSTGVFGTFDDLLDGRPVSFYACSRVALAAGWNRVVEPGTDAFDVQSVVLNMAGQQVRQAVPATGTESVSVTRWTPTRRVLLVAADERSYLVLNQNFNQGWQARVAGRPLLPVRLGGWKQAWLLPAGTRGVVTLTYLPDARYRANLLGGLCALLVVLLVGWAPVRRRRRRPAAVTAAVPAAVPAAGPTAARSSEHPARRFPRWLRLGGGAALGAAGIAVASACGLWIGGYQGALDLPAVTVLFAAGIAFRRFSRVWRLIASPWVAPGLLVAAAIAGAIGEHLIRAGNSGPVASWLWDSGPQLACVVVVGRIAAAIIVPDSPRDAAADELVEPLGRGLEQVVAERGDRDGQRGEHDHQADRLERGVGAALEYVPQVQEVEEAVEDEELPEEDAVGDLAEEPHRPVT